MQRISLDLDKDLFNTKSSSVKLSSKENNALMYDELGSIYIASAVVDPGNKRNTPGNGVYGDPDASIDTIRLNSTVSRKVQNDPEAGNEGCSVVAFVNGFIHYLMAGSADQQTYERYTITDEQPGDWDQYYSTYYTVDNDGVYHYVEPDIDPITGEKTAPTWAADTYYRIEHYNLKFVVQYEQPEDWETNYTDYYFIIYENNLKKYIHIESADTVPTWETDKYYTGVEVGTEPEPEVDES